MITILTSETLPKRLDLQFVSSQSFYRDKFKNGIFITLELSRILAVKCSKRGSHTAKSPFQVFISYWRRVV